ncbi:MAG: LuxR C-terminal-related transcriptional regulator [Halothece sp.]
MLDSARLIFDFQKVNAIIQNLSSCLDSEVIAKEITNALVREFGCAFVRIWLTEPNGQFLRLVASSGLYTRTNGTFARVPMGAYKVGKIAQNCVPFLSNNLPEEPWVKDRNWAIANQLHGFAGYPLQKRDRVVGVLAAFSHTPFLPEFLEVLQVLCMATTVALDSAIQAQQRDKVNHDSASSPHLFSDRCFLSDCLSSVLKSTHLTLVGTEQPLTPGLAYLILRTTEIFNQLHCTYCRLTYGEERVFLEGIVATPELTPTQVLSWARSRFREIDFLSTFLGGKLHTKPSSHKQVIQISLELPYPSCEIQEQTESKLSQREQEVILLLTQGLRDRDIAQKLYISESTVKFHLNNALGKLNAKNRYQGIYEATRQGWI